MNASHEVSTGHYLVVDEATGERVSVESRLSDAIQAAVDHSSKSCFIRAESVDVRVQESHVTLLSDYPTRSEFLDLVAHKAVVAKEYGAGEASVESNPLVDYKGHRIALSEVDTVAHLLGKVVKDVAEEMDQQKATTRGARFLVVDGDDNELFETDDAVAAVNRMNELAFLDSSRSLSVWDRTHDTVWEHLRLGRYLDPQEHPASTIHETMVKALPSPMWPKGMYGCPQDMYGRDQIRGFLIKVSHDLGIE